MKLGCEHLWKSYGGLSVLRDVSLEAPPGRISRVTGPSGAGKTTLLRLLMGLERPDQGRVYDPASWRFGAVFQENRLLERLDAEENLRFALGRDYDPARAAALLGELGLELSPGKPVGEYSGGMKRRLALARALLVPGGALILDEPFTGLDGENRLRAADCIRRCLGERPAVLVSHVPADWEALEALAGAVVELPPPRTAAE